MYLSRNELSLPEDGPASACAIILFAVYWQADGPVEVGEYMHATLLEKLSWKASSRRSSPARRSESELSARVPSPLYNGHYGGPVWHSWSFERVLEGSARGVLLSRGAEDTAVTCDLRTCRIQGSKTDDSLYFHVQIRDVDHQLFNFIPLVRLLFSFTQRCSARHKHEHH